VLYYRGLSGIAPALCQRRVGLSMGNGKIRPPQNPHPLTDHQKICYTLLRWRPLRLCQLWYRSVHEELLGKWVKYIQFLTYFRELTQMSHSSTDFHAWWLKPRVLAQRCGFWGFHWYCSPFRGEAPKTLIMWAWKGTQRNADIWISRLLLPSYVYDSLVPFV